MRFDPAGPSREGAPPRAAEHAAKRICDTRPWAAYLGAALAVKVALFVFFLRFFSPVQPGAVPGFWGVMANDTVGYTRPVEECLAARDIRPLFGYRMPGYGIPYMLFRSVLSEGASLNALTVLQLLLSILSVALLADLAVRLTGVSSAWLALLLGYLIVPILSFFDIVALTESFSASLLAIAIYLLLTARTGQRLTLSGALLAWGVLLRPVFVPVLFLGVAYLAFIARGRPRRTIPAAVALFLAPFALADLTWAAGRFASGARDHLAIPDTFSPAFTDPATHAMPLVDFLKALGIDWDGEQVFYPRAAAVPCPIQTSRFSCDTLVELSRRVRLTQTDLVTLRKDTDRSKILAENERISRDLRVFRQSVVSERPFYYYVVAPGKYLFRLVVASPTHRMFGDYSTMNPRLRPFRFVVDLIWWAVEGCLFVLLIGFRRWRRGSTPLVLLTSVIAYFYLVHTVIFRTNDFRYIVPVIPLILVLVTSLTVICARTRHSKAT